MSDRCVLVHFRRSKPKYFPALRAGLEIKIFALGAEQVSLASRLIFSPKLRKSSFKILQPTQTQVTKPSLSLSASSKRSSTSSASSFFICSCIHEYNSLSSTEPSPFLSIFRANFRKRNFDSSGDIWSYSSANFFDPLIGEKEK
uniref:Uncharacterized protein n=1 Tax=Romanomermis culicivorax TaxID=13658 RepID=A0A915KCW8_ROMCU